MHTVLHPRFNVLPCQANSSWHAYCTKELQEFRQYPCFVLAGVFRPQYLCFVTHLYFLPGVVDLRVLRMSVLTQTSTYVHDVMQSAQKEIALWFKPEELAEYDVLTKAAIYE